MKSLDFYFTSIHDDEEILYIIHRHWFNMFIQFIPAIIMIVLMFMIYMFYPYVFTKEYTSLLFFIESFLLLCIWLYVFMIWFDYYLDVWIITTHRIIDVNQSGLFSRKVSELEYKHIQDISTDIKGFFPTLFNYGNLTVQTAAEQSNFIFRSVANPYKIKTDIMTQIKKRNHT